MSDEPSPAENPLAPKSPPPNPPELPSLATEREEEIVEQAVTAVLQQHSRPAESSLERAVAAKIKPEHINHILETARLREENRHREATDRLKHNPHAGVVIAGMLFVFGLVWLCLSYNKSELLVPLISALVGLVTGGVGGYSLGKSQSKRDEERS